MNAQTKVKADSLASAMANAFAEFVAASKDAKNPHFKSKYADLPAVIDAIKPALINHRLFFTQNTHDSENGVCVETVVHHESGESMSFGRLYVPANKRDAQGYGSALTYARRYSLMTAFGVPADDDDGNAAARSVNTAPAPETVDYQQNYATTGRDEPAAREKLDGKHTSKTALKQALQAYGFKVSAASTVRELDAICAEYAADFKQGEKYLPLWMKGDPSKDNKGLVRLTDERRLFLELLDRMHQNQTQKALSAWLGAYSDEIEALDDGQGREFQRALDEFEEALKLVATTNA